MKFSWVFSAQLSFNLAIVFIYLGSSVTRLCYFLLVLVKDVATKVAQKYFATFGLFWKSLFKNNLHWLLFGNLLDKLGPHLTPTSGHTARKVSWQELRKTQQIITLTLNCSLFHGTRSGRKTMDCDKNNKPKIFINSPTADGAMSTGHLKARKLIGQSLIIGK